MTKFLGMLARGSALVSLLILFLYCEQSLAVGETADKTTAHIEVNADGILVDGKPLPVLFGAEVQYFRARGGSGRNVPAEIVYALWEKLFDALQEAKMNAVIFYIPWDFHEVVEGKFIFDSEAVGAGDQDGDGLADYPSRDVKRFLRRLVERGFKNIMVRPGPYINAEWGPENFGAVPLWFLKKYPEALTMQRKDALPRFAPFARVASYGHETFQKKVKIWFSELYHNVLKVYIGPGKPISFLQIDNESNYFWDSVYARDFNPNALARYHKFIAGKYLTLDALHNVYEGAKLTDWTALMPPREQSEKDFPGPAWHTDWFEFHDEELRSYYNFLRQTWADLGVKSTDVLFTSCDSYNAPKDGLIPRLDYRQDKKLTMTTMNIYPKTFGTQKQSTLNTPMKAAHDALLMQAAHQQFYGGAANWLMSSETIGGWFLPTEVSLNTRSHTYGSLLGSGVRAMMIYYFHEGWNWNGNEKDDTELHFDAPLNAKMEPTFAHTDEQRKRGEAEVTTFDLVKAVGKFMTSEAGARLATTRPEFAPILVAHDTSKQYPSPAAPDLIEDITAESAALFGLFREAGAVAQLGYVDRMSDSALAKLSLVVWHNTGAGFSSAALDKIKTYLKNGGELLILGPAVPELAEVEERVSYWPKTFAKGLGNSDDYVTLKDAAARLAEARAVIAKTNFHSPVNLEIPNGVTQIHAWLRSDPYSKNKFLFVENFGKSALHVSVQLSEFVNKPSVWLRSVFQNPDAANYNAEAVLDKVVELKNGTGLIPVVSDDITIWEVVERP